MPSHSDEFVAALAAALGQAVAPAPEAAARGGCINECYRWRTAGGAVFVKRCPAGRAGLLDAERDSLARLGAAGAVRVPAVLASGTAGDQAFLVLEWLDLCAPDGDSDARLGAALAALHAVRGDGFGLVRDNAIGATPQLNAPARDWPAFWRDRRLGFQLELALRNGHGGRLQDRGSRLMECVPDLLSGHEPLPVLLHGDLWSGNRAALADGTPVVFDPAVYYGDAEADIAMTLLFGGFAPRFYAEYSRHHPAAGGAARRRDLYNLYHVLNHLNLFGGAYRAQAEELIDRLLTVAGR